VFSEAVQALRESGHVGVVFVCHGVEFTNHDNAIFDDLDVEERQTPNFDAANRQLGKVFPLAVPQQDHWYNPARNITRIMGLLIESI
jgi:hypothetical protein